VHFEIAVVGIGLTRQQAFEFTPRGLIAQLAQRSLSLGDDGCLAFGFTELDQLARFVDFPLDPLAAADRLVQPGALAQQFLRIRRIVPQTRVLGLRVQLSETSGRTVPVKDASSAAPATF
jgi:hypothetical protein